MNKILTISYLIFFICSLHAQELYRPGQQREEYLKLGEEATQSENYYSAFHYFQEAYLYDTTATDITYRLAESARLFHAYEYAERMYQKVVSSDQGSQFPAAAYYLAEMQQIQGKYQDAIANYNLYITEYGDDGSYLTERARKEKEACRWAYQRVENAPDNILIEHLDESINSPYSDFGALVKGDQLYFSSMKYPVLAKGKSMGKLRSKILLNEAGQSEVQEDFLVDDIQGAAHTSISKDSKMLYYTLCDYVNDSKLNCKIYVREMEDGHWGTAKILPEYINVPGYTATDPSISFDADLGKYILYFVSDMPGGRGNKDIWYSVLNENMEYSAPVNMSGVNTAEDDISPYMHAESSMLYFSSKGYRGLGGFDVYKCRVGGKGWGKVEPLPAPVNSSYNDIYYTLSPDRGTAYVASNRVDAFHLESEPKACCFDIYKLTYLPCNIRMLTAIMNAETKDSLRGATLLLINKDTRDTLTFQNDIASLYKVPVDCDSRYSLVATKNGFLPASVDLQTPLSVKDTTIQRTLYLKPQRIEVLVQTFNKNTGKPLSCVDVLMSDSKNNQLLSSKKTCPDNETIFTVIPGTRLVFKGKKFAYLPDTKSLDLSTPKDGPIVIKLYLTPSLPSVLPIALYFDNDRPGRRSWKRTTKESYTDTYLKYYPKKQEFIDRYSEGGASADGERIASFFQTRVKAGYDQLQLFLEVLESEMKLGNKYRIEIRGYTSPRASSGYNKNLAARRISSIKNEFRRYKGGILLPYLKNGSLVIAKERAIGESELPEEILKIRSILENLKDERNSIYSPEASGMRRIDISNVTAK